MSFFKCIKHPTTRKAILVNTSILSVYMIVTSIDLIIATEKQASMQFQTASSEMIDFLRTPLLESELPNGYIIGLSAALFAACVLAYCLSQLNSVKPVVNRQLKPPEEDARVFVPNWNYRSPTQTNWDKHISPHKKSQILEVEDASPLSSSGEEEQLSGSQNGLVSS